MPGILDTYRAVITADNQTLPGVRAAQRTIGEGLKKTGVGASGVEADKAAGAWGKLSVTLGRLPGNLKVLYHSGGLGRAVDELKEGRRAVDDMGQSLRAFVPATAALTTLGTGAGIGEMLRDFATYGTQLRNAAAPLNVATQDLERWQMAGERAGVTATAVAQDFAQFNSKIMGAAYGSDASAVQLFNYFGVAARNADGSIRKVTDLIPDIFRQFKAQSDPRIQHQLLDAFGLGDLDPLFRRANNLAELMDMLRAKDPLSKEQIKRASDLNSSFAGLEQSVGQFSRALSAELQPSLGPVLDTMGKWLDANRNNNEVMGEVKLATEAVAGLVGLTLVGAIARATKAVLAFNAAWLLNPYFLGLAGLGALTYGGYKGQQKGVEDQGALIDQFGNVIGTPNNKPVDRREHGMGALGKWLGGTTFGHWLWGNSRGAQSSFQSGGGVSQAFAQSGIPPVAQRFMADIASGEARSFDQLAGRGPGSANAYGSRSGYAGFPDWEGMQHTFGGQLVTSHGAGLFQDEPGTWKRIAEGGGFTDFRDPLQQIRGNWWWAQKVYSEASGRNLLTDLQNDALDPRGRAALGTQWARGAVASGESDRLATSLSGGNDMGVPNLSGALAAQDSRHKVEVSFVNAPAGMRSGLRLAEGPADFDLRVEHAMATQ